MCNDGFAPPGFFCKFIATILSKCTETVCYDRSSILSQYLVIVCYGAQKFRLRHVAALNCIVVDVEGQYPLGVLRMLQDSARTVLDECMKTVKSRVFLPMETGGDSGMQQHSLGRCAEKMKAEYFISLAAVERAVIANLPLIRPGTRCFFKASEIPPLFRKFVVLKVLLLLYDLFLSYRWDVDDQNLVTLLFEALSLLVIGDELRGMDVFADIKRLQPGRSFVKDFAFALLNSDLVIPIITPNALTGMKVATFQPHERDNVLLEWILALHMVEMYPSKRVYPIIMGGLDPASGKRLPFDWDILNELAGQFDLLVLSVLLLVLLLLLYQMY